MIACPYCKSGRAVHARGRCSTCYARAYKADSEFARHYAPGVTCQLCEKPVEAHGLCQTHYMRQYRHGDPAVVCRLGRMAVRPICGADGCDRPHYAQGWCRSHYDRARVQKRLARLEAMR